MTTAKEAVESIQKQRKDAGISFLGWVNLTVEHYNAVVEALEKQIPKKALERIIDDDLVLMHCPTCNVRFLRQGMLYCGNCGQALDWGEAD